MLEQGESLQGGNHDDAATCHDVHDVCKKLVIYDAYDVPSGSTLRVKNCVQDLQPPAPTAILVSGPRSSLSKHQMIIILPNGPASNHQSENINDNHHQTIHSGRMDIIQIVKI